MKSWNEIRKDATKFAHRWKGAYDEKPLRRAGLGGDGAIGNKRPGWIHLQPGLLAFGALGLFKIPPLLEVPQFFRHENVRTPVNKG